jgi:hypothetical protein
LQLQGDRKRKHRLASSVSNRTATRLPAFVAVLVSGLQPGAGQRRQIPERGRQLVAQEIWTHLASAREMFNQGIGTSVRLEIVSSHLCLPAQTAVPFHTKAPLVNAEKLQSNRYWLPEGARSPK